MMFNCLGELWLYVITYTPLIISVYLLIIPTFGIKTGISRCYIKLLMSIFEFCRQTIEKQERKTRLHQLRSIDLETSSDEDDKKDHEEKRNAIKDFFLRNDNEDGDYVHEFVLSDIFDFIVRGIEAVADDEVTKRFSTEELQTWNLLTRTNKNYLNVSYKLLLFWSIGWIFRFCVLFPIRMFIFVFGMLYLLITMALVGLLKECSFKKWLYDHTSVIAFRMLSRSLSATINYHDTQYKPKGGSLCVANHTSPLDVLILHNDNPYAIVGQLHGGFLGLIETALNRATSHCFFDRFEVNDRSAVVRKMRQHIMDPKKLPILIFPEGTCINNSAVMMFKKGSFEVADVVYPVAIKYDQIFGDPFWDSSKYGYFTYIIRMMTSWAIVCDVWYMKPMTREDHESAVDFANRVKKAIARRGGLVDLEWDGQLKRQRVKPELRAKVQSEYSRKLSTKKAPNPSELFLTNNAINSINTLETNISNTN
ncbi:glycerol-3-phosphate acyltransferase 3 [Tetranychus urticae]|uniref:Phospholipid/glycerol acyltransferase domain-containing protein n=1 Tax=Tetranychus urticae TaxID=32264 RepID=T1KSS0_TETUR|nr:glycerol-3-phosphate acyltransferase 3 [Tetranychus urticae]